jgi:hypothetical protein
MDEHGGLHSFAATNDGGGGWAFRDDWVQWWSGGEAIVTEVDDPDGCI